MNEEQCSICLGDLRDPDMEVYETKCGHKFHRDCLLNYCTISNSDRDLNHVGISCPLCNTGLNCRFNGGVDIFPEIINNNDNANNMETHIVQPPSNIVRALSVIPEDEYEFIDTVDDINIPQLPNLTLEEKQLILAEILRKRAAGEDEEIEGGKRKSKRNKSKKQRKQTNKKRNKSKRKSKRNKSKRRNQSKKSKKR
jgi:hypothetical protein